MIPKNSECGCLETLLLDPIYEQAPQVRTALDQYCGLTQIDSLGTLKIRESKTENYGC